jgi:AraC family transcriptional regulator
MMLRRLWESAAGERDVDPYLGDGLLMSVVSQLFVKAGTSLRRDAPVVLPKWRVSRVREYVDANLDRDISLENLADAAGLSRRHFVRSFRQELGATPHKWLMERRLDEAKALLTNSEMRLCDIAASCGFSSQSHLTSALKKDAGITPLRWRQRYRQ